MSGRLVRSSSTDLASQHGFFTQEEEEEAQHGFFRKRSVKTEEEGMLGIGYYNVILGAGLRQKRRGGDQVW